MADTVASGSRFAMVALLSVLVTAQFRDYSEQEIPQPTSGWWGRGDGIGHVDDPTVRQFWIDVNDTVLNDLNRRLDETIFPEPVEGVNFEYGFNSNYLREVVAYWRNRFNWREQQNRINSFPQFKTQIEGIDVYFMHARPQNVPEGIKVLPLLIAHGWLGSFVEFLDLIPLLTTPGDGIGFIFEVVLPSIPGFGFSEAPHQKGFGPVAAAQVFGKLLERLGFQFFYVHGGDLGAVIVNNMAVLYPRKVMGMHVNGVNLCPHCAHVTGVISHFYFPQSPNATDVQKAAFVDGINAMQEEMGYLLIQSTKPATIGLAVTQSPAGLAAYLLEKIASAINFQSVHAPDGLLTKEVAMDQHLTNIMVFWISGSVATSMNYFKERFSKIEQRYNIDTMIIKVPSAVAVFPHEGLMASEANIRTRMVNLLSYNRMPRGGHFAALEEPQLLSDDIWKFVATVEQMTNRPQN